MTLGSDVIVTNVGIPDTVVILPDQSSTVVIKPDRAAPLQPLSGPNQAWVNAAGKRECAARLERLPAGLDLGAGVDEPIHYDATRRLLLYRGFMCHGSYLYLRNLSSELDYLSAVDQLYVRSASQTPTRRGYSALLGLVITVLAALAAFGIWRFVHG